MGQRPIGWVSSQSAGTMWMQPITVDGKSAYGNQYMGLHSLDAFPDDARTTNG
jgi:hypothetical protein